MSAREVQLCKETKLRWTFSLKTSKLKPPMTTPEWRPPTRFRTLRQIFLQTKRHVREGDLRLVMASLSYSTVLSMIPLIALALATFKAIGGLQSWAPKVEELILSNLTIGASESALKFVHRAIAKIHAGKLGSYGFLFLLYTSLRLVQDIDLSVQKIWQIRERNPFYKRLLKYWAMLLFFPLILSVYVGLMTYAPSYADVKEVPYELFQFFMLFSFLYLMYKLVPATKVKIGPALVAAAFTAVALIVSRVGLSYSVKSFIRYDKVYGSLASIPVLFLSISLGWYLVIFGVALTAGLQRWREDEEAPLQFGDSNLK